MLVGGLGYCLLFGGGIGGTDYRPMNGSGKHAHGSTLGSLPSLSADIGDFGERGSTHTLDGLAPSLPRVASRWRKRSRRKNRKKRQIWDRFNVASQIYSDIVWTLLLSVMTSRARAMIKKKKAADLSEPQSEASIEYPTHHFID